MTLLKIIKQHQNCFILITELVQSCLPPPSPPAPTSKPQHSPHSEREQQLISRLWHAYNPGISTLGLSRKTPWVTPLIWGGCNFYTHWRSAQEKWVRGGRRRREVESVHRGQRSGRGKRSCLLHQKENIKQEKGGEGASGRKDQRGGAHLDYYFFSKKKKRKCSFRGGRCLFSICTLLSLFQYNEKLSSGSFVALLSLCLRCPHATG